MVGGSGLVIYTTLFLMSKSDKKFRNLFNTIVKPKSSTPKPLVTPDPTTSRSNEFTLDFEGTIKNKEYQRMLFDQKLIWFEKHKGQYTNHEKLELNWHKTWNESFNPFGEFRKDKAFRKTLKAKGII